LSVASKAMSLYVYSGLFDADLDSVAVQLDSSPRCVTGLSRAEVIELPKAAKQRLTSPVTGERGAVPLSGKLRILQLLDQHFISGG
jgi:hypothetical protein